MNRLGLLLAILIANFTTGMAQTADPVVMTVNGRPVPRSEFEYAFHKNSKLQSEAERVSVADYAEMFANYKLKVAEAEATGIDTTESFRREYAMYRDIQLKPYLVDSAYIDSVARGVYDRYAERVGGRDLLLVSHILIRVPQQADDAADAAARAKADSLYSLLQGGADFATIARMYSHDTPSARNGGEMPWIAPGNTLQEFEDVIYALAPGQTSGVFRSPVGYHIARLIDRKKLEPYAERRPDILEYLKRQNIEEKSADQKIERVMEQTGQSREEVMESVMRNAIADNDNLRYLLREYYEGLLLVAVSERDVWKTASADTEALDAFFKKNKNNYKWSEPRFKGFVVHSRNEKSLKEALKLLKKAGTTAVLKGTLNSDTLTVVKADRGVYKKGDNAYVDMHVFGGKEAVGMPSFTHNAVQGKKLKQPKEWTDVRAAVTADYQSEVESRWVKELRSKYPVVINREVLSTVADER